ncbi:MAG: histone deacetylase [Bacteriovoracaceae bacterium]
MIYLRPSSRRKLSDFGIEVPLLDDRVELTLKALSEKALAQVFQSEKPWIVEADLTRVHTTSYIKELLSPKPDQAVMKCYELVDQNGNFHRYDPKKQTKSFIDLVNYALSHVQGTYEASLHALNDGHCFFLGGGLHHAFPDEGRGFCLIHDVAIAIRKLQALNKIETAWVIDIDAHKGDGTALIFADDATVKTFSIHMKQGWPLDMGEGAWHTASTVDVEISAHEEQDYNKKLNEGLMLLAKDAQIPDICFVVMGSDPYEHDVLPSAGLLKLSLSQMKERDQLVRKFLEEKKIPQVYVMAGGYGPRVHEVYAQFANEILYP